MPKTRKEKEKILQELIHILEIHPNWAVFDFKGLASEDLTELRKRTRQKGGLIKVVKKTLLQRAVEEKGVKMDILGLEGQLALVLMGQDFISPLKEVYSFAQELQKDTPRLLIGFVESRITNREELEELATLPSLEQLRAKLVGTFFHPLYSFMGVMSSPLKGLLVVLNSKE